MDWIGLTVSQLWGGISALLFISALLAVINLFIYCMGFIKGAVPRRTTALSATISALLIVLFSVLLGSGFWLFTEVLSFGHTKIEKVVYWVFVGLTVLLILPQIPAKLQSTWRAAMVPRSSDADINKAINDDIEEIFADASRASVWILWYFKQGWLTLLTVPLFLFLVYAIVISAYGAVNTELALSRASNAVFGRVGSVIVGLAGWIPIIPPLLYYLLAKNLPRLWLNQDASRSTKIWSSFVILVFLPLGAYLIFHAVVFGISWIADRNLCAAYAAGVIGSKPPIDCP